MQQVSQMRKLLLRSGIHPELLGKIEIEMEAIDNKDILILEMSKVCNTTYARAYKVWTSPHISEEMWNYYDLVGEKDMPEQKSLRAALKKLHVHFMRLARRFCRETFRAEQDCVHVQESVEEAGPCVQSDTQCEKS